MIQRRMHRVAVAAVAGILVILGGGPAAAATLDFYCISGNNVTSCADGEAQVLMDRTGYRLWGPEVLRLQGEALLSAGGPAQAGGYQSQASECRRYSIVHFFGQG